MLTPNALLKMVSLKTCYIMLRSVVVPARIHEAMDDHHRWLYQLESEGKIILSGPTFLQDESPDAGVTLFVAKDFEHAEALAVRDPLVTSGAVTFQIRRWELKEGILLAK
ncbi:YciI family protein [Erwinia typographi]|uniref:YciI family protein n=1 Tax=Erwinia typographi TaxID=371042 RepID=UPI00068AA31B|nr:YciI family protein [Erwinia typographi]